MQLYPHIENDYREMFIKSFLEQNPELIDAEYIIEEKIHGENYRFHFDKGIVTFGTRNQEKGTWTEDTTVIEFIKIRPVIDFFKQWSIITNRTYTIYGERYGPKIQKGINYGSKEVNIKFFDMRVDDLLISPIRFLEHFDDFSQFVVPILAKVKGLQAALDYNCEFLTKLNPIENNWAEGIVIKPLNSVYYNALHELFYLKKKHPKFKELCRSPKEIKIAEFKDSVLLPYINDNRVQSVFSKEGKISNKTQIANYIKLVTQDAIEDFKRDQPDYELTPNDLAVGKFIVPLLLKEM
jgi:Rnl2 family RNA ligase